MRDEQPRFTAGGRYRPDVAAGNERDLLPVGRDARLREGDARRRVRSPHPTAHRTPAPTPTRKRTRVGDPAPTPTRKRTRVGDPAGGPGRGGGIRDAGSTRYVHARRDRYRKGHRGEEQERG